MKNDKIIAKFIGMIILADVALHSILFIKNKSLFYMLTDYHKYVGKYSFMCGAIAGAVWLLTDLLADYGIILTKRNK